MQENNQKPSKPRIVLKYETHRLEPVISFQFEYNEKLNREVMRLPGVRWTRTLNCWVQPEKHFDLHKVWTQLNAFAFLDYNDLKKMGESNSQKSSGNIVKKKKNRPDYSHRKTTKIPPEYLDMLIQERKSESTIRIYIGYFKDFCFAFRDYDLTDITKDEINAFIVKLIKGYEISDSQQNQRINAIKFYYEKVLGRPREIYQIERPRKENSLPDVLSKEEIAKMLKVKNIKHRCIIGLLYSCGLRRSEVVNMKVDHINSDRMMIKVVQGKGKKDRYVNISPTLLNLIDEYRIKYQPEEYLLEGQFHKKYSAESVFNVVKKTAFTYGIRKRVYPHILRHSFATHNIEQGIHTLHTRMDGTRQYKNNRAIHACSQQ